VLLAQAREFEWGSAVSAALTQLVQYFETPVPQVLLDALYRQSDRNSARVTNLQDQPITHTLEEYQKLKSLSWQGRFRLIAALVVPSPAYMRRRYRLTTSWTLPAWYLYRWWGIFKDFIRTVRVMVQEVVV
jgi:hypothetical protein